MGSGTTPYSHELSKLLRQYRLALAREPKNPQILVDIAKVVLKLDRTEEALTYFHRACQIYFEQGFYADTISVCGRILRSSPHDEGAMEMVERVRSTSDLLPEELDAALHRVRTRRVSDGQPVVVLPTKDEVVMDLEEGSGEWEDTHERTTPPLRPGVDRDPAALTRAPGRVVDSPPGETAVSEAPGIFDTPTRRTPKDDGPTLPGEPGPGALAKFDSAEGPTQPDAPAPRDSYSAVSVDPDEGPTVPAGSPSLFDHPAGPLPVPGELASAAIDRRCSTNEVILDEQQDNSALFIIQRGRVVVSKASPSGAPTEITTLGEGEWFGELAVLGDGTSHQRYRALERCEISVFEEGQVKKLLRDTSVSGHLRKSFRARLQQALLRISPLLAGLLPGESRMLLQKCRPVRRLAGQAVIRQGDQATGLYLVLLGQLLASVAQRPGSTPQIVGSISDGDFFGEMSLLDKGPTVASVTARRFCQLMVLPPQEFHRFAESHPSFLRLITDEANRRKEVNEAVRAGKARFENGELVYLLKS
jgi:CRP-like cAMP-binding protein